MNMLLRTLRNLHGYQKNELARLLCISEQEYNEIESGPHEMSEQQAETLARLFKSDTSNVASESTGVVIYNIGYNSRAIANVANDYKSNQEETERQSK
jgi:DNA-binding XRE family transcriptional regulator